METPASDRAGENPAHLPLSQDEKVRRRRERADPTCRKTAGEWQYNNTQWEDDAEEQDRRARV